MDGKHKKEKDACPDLETAKTEVRKKFESLLAFCCGSDSERQKFHRFEAELLRRVFELARLLVMLFLLSLVRVERTPWTGETSAAGRWLWADRETLRRAQINGRLAKALKTY